MEGNDNAPISAPDTQGKSPFSDPVTELATRKISRRSLIGKGILAGISTTALGQLLVSCGGGGSSGPVTIQFAA